MMSCFTSLASTFHCLASCRMKIGLLGCVCLRRSYPSTIVLQTRRCPGMRVLLGGARTTIISTATANTIVVIEVIAELMFITIFVVLLDFAVKLLF